MKVERDSTVVASSCADRAESEAVAPAKTISEVVGRLEGGEARYVAVAPGRLDVLGGLAEYSGVLVLGLTMGHHVGVAAQRRTDGKLWIAGCPSGAGGRLMGVPVSKLIESNGQAAKAARSSDAALGELDESALCVVGALVEGVRGGLFPAPEQGFSVSVGCALDGIHGGGRHAATAAATLAAATVVMEREPQPLAIAAACQRVENNWLNAPVGLADAACALLGESDALLEVRCESGTLGGTLRLPEAVLLLGIDSGILQKDAAAKYRHVRTATYMGRLLVDRIIQHGGMTDVQWDGFLSRLSITDFVERFRDRLPTKIKGKEFLDRFGETGDPLTRIDPAGMYKVRSRTEHHVYEHARARQFVECLSRNSRNRDPAALTDAGELMHASHWSYGQRCGLGSVETDLLVTLIRRHGKEAGVYGAKITGRGCGGLVAVLLERSEQGLAALEAALEDYGTRSGRRARILRGSTPGALISGVRRV